MDESRSMSASNAREEASPADRWRALAASSREIAAAGSPRAILDLTATAARELTGALVSNAGPADAEAAPSFGDAIGAIDPEARWQVMEENRPLRCADVGIARRPECGGDGPTAERLDGWLGVPLFTGPGGNAGVIEVAGKSGGFDDIDEAILVQLATVASVALRNVLLAAEVGAAGEAARAEAAPYRALVEHGPDAVVVYGIDGRARFASPASERLLGCSLADIPGRDTSRRIHPDDRPLVDAA